MSVNDQSSWLGLFMASNWKKQDNSFTISQFFPGLRANEVGWRLGGGELEGGQERAGKGRQEAERILSRKQHSLQAACP